MIRALVEKCEGNQSEAARIIGVSPSYIHEIAAGKKTVRYPRPPTLAALHRALGFPISINEPSATYMTSRFKEVRIYGLAQACTMTNPPCDIMPTVDDSELPTVVVPAATGRRMAAFRVEGDSMSPKLTNGMIVICDCDDKEFQNGNIVVAKFHDTAVIKRYRRVGDTIILTSDNQPAGKDYELHANDIQWMIKAVGFQGGL